MPLGQFSVTIDGAQIGGGEEKTAKLTVTANVGTLNFPDADEFRFPRQKAINISLPYTLTLDTDTTSGDSTNIGYTVLVTTNHGGRVETSFAARQAGSTIALTDVTPAVIVPVNEAIQYVAEAQAAAADAEDHEIAAEAAAAEAAAFGGTNNAQVAEMVTGAGPTKDALSATYAPVAPVSELLLTNYRAAAAAKRAAGLPVDLAFYGDSITYGLFQPDPLQTNSYPSRLRDRMGYAEGIIWPNQNQTVTGGASTFDTRFVNNGGWTFGTGAGPGNKTVMVGGSSATASTFDPGYPWDTCELWYYRQPAGGFLGYAVDGGTEVGVNTAGTAAIQKITLSQTYGSHVLKLRPAGGGQPWVAAFRFSSPSTRQNRFTVSRCGIPGSSTTDWVADTDATKTLAPAFDMADPDLTVLLLGSNDYDQQIPLATVASNLTTIVNRARSNGGGIVLAIANKPLDSKAISWESYVSQIKTTAASLNVAVIDHTPSFIDKTTNPGLYADSYHPSTAGYETLASDTVRFLQAAQIATGTTPPTVALPVTYSSDSFTRADSASWGSTDGGGVYAWSGVGVSTTSPTAGINTNRMVLQGTDTAGTNTTPGTVTIDDGHNDGRWSLKIDSKFGQAGLFVCGSTDTLSGYVLRTLSTGGYSFDKRTGATTMTNLATGGTYAAGDVLTITRSVSGQLTAKVNSTVIYSGTDTSFAGTRHGAWTMNANAGGGYVKAWSHTSV